jgi:hypothetical protein
MTRRITPLPKFVLVLEPHIGEEFKAEFTPDLEHLFQRSQTFRDTLGDNFNELKRLLEEATTRISAEAVEANATWGRVGAGVQRLGDGVQQVGGVAKMCLKWIMIGGFYVCLWYTMFLQQQAAERRLENMDVSFHHHHHHHHPSPHHSVFHLLGRIRTPARSRSLVPQP